MTKTTRCIAITAKGDQCGARALRGRAVCAAHAGPSRLEDLESACVDIMSQVITSDGEAVDPDLKVKVAQQVIDRIDRRAKQSPTAPAAAPPADDEWEELFDWTTKAERDEIISLCERLDVIKKAALVRRAIGGPRPESAA